MATCKRCDKCGKIYNEDDRFSVRYSAKRLHSIKIEEINCLGDITERDIDLCPQCVEKFNEFMKQDKIEKENAPEYTPLDVFLTAYEQTKFINKCLIKIASGEQIENDEVHILSIMSSGNAIYDKLDKENKND